MSDISSEKIKVTLLGTGTSQGVPVIGCECEVCTSVNTRDKRLRTSVLVSSLTHNIVIDTGPDFRQQMLREQVKSLSGILITHEHNDHVIGLDDVRPFNFRQKMAMPIHATKRVLSELKVRFPYVFEKNPYPGAPSIDLMEIQNDESFRVGGIPFLPIQVMHGRLPVLGFRIGDLTYITDAKTIAPEELEKIKGSRILVLNALHHQEHHSHLNLEQAIELITQINPQQAYLTHISHKMGLAAQLNHSLPQNISLAYDTQQFEVNL